MKPDAEVIFSTYNWCYESDELREGFLERWRYSVEDGKSAPVRSGFAYWNVRIKFFALAAEYSI